MFVNRYQFYSEIVNGDKSVKDIFSSLSSMSPLDYDELSNEFSDKLNQNFEPNNDNRNNHSQISRYKIPPKIYTRVRLTIILLSVCALGATFDDNVYSYTLDFVLKRELCLVPLSLN